MHCGTEVASIDSTLWSGAIVRGVGGGTGGLPSPPGQHRRFSRRAQCHAHRQDVSERTDQGLGDMWRQSWISSLRSLKLRCRLVPLRSSRSTGFPPVTCLFHRNLHTWMLATGLLFRKDPSSTAVLREHRAGDRWQRGCRATLEVLSSSLSSLSVQRGKRGEQGTSTSQILFQRLGGGALLIQI